MSEKDGDSLAASNVYGTSDLLFDVVSIVSEGREVRNFEDLIAWQKARALTKAIYEATKRQPFAKDFGLTSQLQRAGVSIMSNIAEGHERGSANEYHHYLLIAKGSCAEVRSQLYVALDANYLTKDDFDRLSALTIEVGKLIGGLRKAIGEYRR